MYTQYTCQHMFECLVTNMVKFVHSSTGARYSNKLRFGIHLTSCALKHSSISSYIPRPPLSLHSSMKLIYNECVIVKSCLNQRLYHAWFSFIHWFLIRLYFNQSKVYRLFEQIYLIVPNSKFPVKNFSESTLARFLMINYSGRLHSLLASCCLEFCTSWETACLVLSNTENT